MIKFAQHILLLLLPCCLQGQYYVDYNEAIKAAYTDAIMLDYDSAVDKLKHIEQDDPYNLARVHIENYIDFFTIFIKEEKSYFEKQKKQRKKRLNLIDKLEDEDPYKRFLQAEVNLQWALVRAKFNELFNSGKEIYTAFKLLEDNVAAHPDFLLNYKSLSAIHALAETISIPGFFKDLFGIYGTVDLGIKEIEKVLSEANSEEFMFMYEAEAIYAFILFYQGKQEQRAIRFLEEASLAETNIPLARFVELKLLQRAGENEKALNLLEHTLAVVKPEDFPYLYFMMGTSKLRSLDEEANVYFQLFLDNFNGQHYIKEAYQKMAWYELVFNNDIPKYKNYLYQCDQYGNALIDDDKQAQREAESNNIPNPILLKARLLYDGGYYHAAFNLMIKNAHLFFNDETYNLEYFYRLARICQNLKNYTDAISYFEKSIEADADGSSYMSCNAALQLGIIYEQQRSFEQARKYFNKCLKLSPDEYKNSLHQKAKTGLNRVKGK